MNEQPKPELSEEDLLTYEPVDGPTRENPDFKTADSYMHKIYNQPNKGEEENEQN